MAVEFDRYRFTRSGESTFTPPFVKIEERNTDKYEKYFIGISRLDKISYKFYNDATLGSIILMANPNFSSEHDIPDGEVIRIPFPINQVITEIETKTEKILNM